MHRISRYALLSLCCLALATAHGAPATYDVPLWRFSDENNTVHVLGSLHALKPADHPLPDRVYQVFDAADRIVLEVDVSTVGARRAGALTREYGYFEPPQTLSRSLTPETRALLAEYLAADGESIARYDGVKPWFVSIQIGLREIRKLGYEPRLGVDMHLLERALTAYKPVSALETFEEQMQALSADPLPLQDLALRASLERVDRFAADLEAMVGAWKRADIDALYQAGIAGEVDYPALAPQIERIIHARNATMADAIRELIDGDEDTLVVVGAMHLGGDRGILALLSPYHAAERVKVQ